MASNHTQGHDEVKACGAMLSFPLTVANDHLCFNNHAMVWCVFMWFYVILTS